MAEFMRASSPTQLHAILVCFPTQGHINPTLELANRLVARGVSVTFVNFENIISQIRSHGIAQSDQINFVGLPDGLPPDHPRSPMHFEYLEVVQRMIVVFEPFIRKLVKEAFPISCIISDTFMPWTRDVALKFNIPRILLWTSSAASFSIFLHAQLLVGKGVIPDPDAPHSASGESKSAEEVIDYIPGVVRLLPADIPAVLKASDWRSRFLVKSLQQIEDAPWVLVHSLYELEREVFEGLREARRPLLPVGPLFSDRCGDDGGDEECLRWLNDREKASVLYIALGSVYEAEQQEVEEIAAALEKSEVSFVWVVRVNVTNEVVLDGLLERTKGKGLLVPWAPQKKVLGHSAIAGFISHCGWNSTLESVSSGVPIIAWPQEAEQHLNSKYVVDHWQVGIRLSPRIDRDDVCLAIQALMYGEVGTRIRANVNALSLSCSSTMSSHSNIHMVVRALSQSKVNSIAPS